MLGEAVRIFLEQETGGAKAAATVLASPQFAQMLKVATREGYVEGSVITKKLNRAEMAFQATSVFKKWVKTLDDNQKAQLASVGMVGYLFNSLPDESQEQSE